MNSPQISIVIPLYNKETEIESTLKSVFAQKFTDFEILIINDGSTDNSVNVIESSFHDPRIKIFSQTNAGVGAARNHGIKMASGEFIAFIDADDEWDPEYLETQISLKNKFPQCNVFATLYKLKSSENGATIANINPKYLSFSGQEGVLKDYFQLACNSNPPLWTSAVVVRKSAIDDIGGFPTGVKSGEDLLTWARLACANNIAYSNVPLATYNLGHSNPRPPEKYDTIAGEFLKLWEKYPENKYLKKYIERWNAMRMCRCLGHRMYGRAFKAFFKVVKSNPFDIKIYHSAIKFTFIGLKNRR